jgi:hypothetical protein
VSVGCLKNGDLPKSRFAQLAAFIAIGRHDLNLKIDVACSAGAVGTQALPPAF